MKARLRSLTVWTLCLLAFLAIYQLARPATLPRVDFAELRADVASGDAIAELRIDGNEITVRRWDGWEYTALGMVDEPLMHALSEQGVAIAWGPEARPLRTLLLVGGPILLILALFLYYLRKLQGGGQNILAMRKSTARLVPSQSGVGFADVGGCEEAKEQLRDLIDFLRHPERWTRSGVRLPRGVLLEGPPGCGKTLLARAVAGESEARFYLVSASEFVEMFVGVGAARVRDTFETAAKNAPAVIFIDELDAVGRRRGSGVGAANDEREQTLNQLLVQLDGFDAPDRVVVIAATNRADVLDPALLRPGRFDRRVAIGMLDRDQRRQVLEIHTHGLPLAPETSLDALAGESEGMSGAELESWINEAGLLAVRRVRAGSESEARIRPEDFHAVRQQRARDSRRFDCVDALLVESTTQIAHPTGVARVRLTLLEGKVVEGELVWADATMIKLRGESGGESLLVAKHQIKTIEALDGTQWAADVAPDPFVGRTPDLA